MMRCRRATVILSLILSVSMLAGTISFVMADENYWVTKESMQVARGGLGVVAVNGKVYAIGGSNKSGLYPPDLSGGFVGTNEEYDPETDTWTFKASMPTPRAYFAIAAYENKIYCIGGTVSVGLDVISQLLLEHINSGVNEVYDPATDTWETRTPMPTARRNAEAHVVNGKIYLIGENLNEVYDPAKDTWTTKTPVPGGARPFASAVFDDTIYVMTSGLNQIYDTKTDSWSQGTPAPTDVIGGTAVATTGVMSSKRIYVLGVKSGDEPPRGNHVYDPENASWTSGATVLINRRDFGAAVVNDELYTVGGYTYDNNPNSGHVTASAVNERYTPFGYGTPDPSYVPPDTVAPEVSVISPQNGTSYKPDLLLNFTVNESVSYMRYKLDGETVAEVEGNTTLNGLAAGLHNLTVYATDGGGNTGASETIHFTVDDTAPFLSVLTPENTTYDVTEVPLNFTVNEEASGMSYSLDGQETVPITGNTTLSGLPSGLHNITVYAEDLAGNIGTSTATTFTVATETGYPQATVVGIAVGASLIVIAVGLILYFKKGKARP